MAGLEDTNSRDCKQCAGRGPARLELAVEDAAATEIQNLRVGVFPHDFFQGQ